MTKYIKKKALLPESPSNDYNIEKYRAMDEENYHKLITDLIGIRILIRYQQQWEVVHNWVWKNFYKSHRTYIGNWVEDYPAGVNEDFIVEKPKVYLRRENDLPLYQTLGKDIFEYHISNEGYSSIHYLLWYDGKYVELQVRTVYDEAWSECTHDLVYKCKNKARRNELEKLSGCLAIQTQAAEVISSMMFEKAEISSEKKQEELIILPKNEAEKKQTFIKLQNQIAKLSSGKTSDKVFDGSVDDLI